MKMGCPVNKQSPGLERSHWPNGTSTERITKLAMRAKRKYKKGGSRTRTSTATIAEEATGNTHSALNTQTIKVGNWKRPKASTVGKWRYQQTYRYNLTSQAGLQNVTPIVCPLHYNKIFVNSGGAYNYNQNYTALEVLNPYLTPTIGVGPNNYGNVAVPQNDRFIINSVNLQCEFTNFSLVGCFLDIYVVCCKKPTVDDAVNMWSKGLVYQSLGLTQMQQPNAATSTSVAGSSFPAAAGYPTVNAVDTHPREVKLFGEFYKTHRVKRMMMTGGSTETLNIDIGINKVLKCEQYRELSSGGAGFLDGVTWEVFVVQRGSLVEDQASGGTANPNPHLPTYGDTRVGLIVQEKYVMCGVMGNTTRLNTSYEYSNVPYGTSQGNEGILNVIDTLQVVASSVVQ